MADNQVSRITVRGFKSIRDVTLELRDLNVLIGPNGAGKSNLIAFFRMLAYMLSSNGSLRLYVGRTYGASRILHDGPARTHEIEGLLEFDTKAGHNEYAFRLFHAAGDTLVFADERCRFYNPAWGSNQRWIELGVGHKESGLLSAPAPGRTAPTILGLLRGYVVYQFHDTSASARIKTKWAVGDNRFLKEDGANLAPILLRLRERNRKYYDRIVSSLHDVLPFFADFVLEPDNGSVYLQWMERESDMIFGVDQAADGMLRTLSLFSLLQLPPEDLPSLLILDEPELGLHPAAIGIMAGMLKALSAQRQILMATQSPALLDHFSADDVIVVERRGRESIYSRQSSDKLAEWRKEYSMSELWNKNVFGGRP